MTLTLPTIHINGTSRAALVGAYDAAHIAITRAYAALSETAPNGRDYYPQGRDAFPRAAKEHLARLAKLAEIRAELEALGAAATDALRVSGN